MSIKVELYLGSAWRSVEAQQPIIVNEALHNSLASATSSCRVNIIPSIIIKNYLLGLENTDADIRIKDGSTILFQGLLRKNFTIRKTAQRQDLYGLEAVGYLIKLDRKIKEDKQYVSKSVSYIVENLLTELGINYSLPTITSTINNLYIKRGESYRIIEQILKEYGYILYVDKAGTARAIEISPATIATTKTFNDTNTLDAIALNKKEQDKERIEVEYKQQKTATSGIVFSDTTNAQGIYKCYIQLAAGAYLGGQQYIYADLSYNSNKIIALSSHTLDINADSGISVLGNTLEGNRVKLSIQNTSGTMKNIYKLDIIGNNIVYEDAAGKEIATSNSATDKIETIKAKYIFTSTNAQSYAQKLLNYYKYSDFVYTLSSKTDATLGEQVLLNHAGIGSINARIIEKQKNYQTGIIKYKLEGISEYNPETADSEPVYTAPIPQISRKVVRLRLYQELSTTPSKPTNNVVYTINTGAYTGINNGWLTAMPDAKRKPIWEIHYYTVTEQDSITITESEWSTPTKIYVGMPQYLGTISTIPDSGSFLETRIDGDWCLCTANGKFYKWTGTAWTDTGITTDNKMAALQDLLEIADASDTIAFAETLVSIDAFIQNLMAKNLQLQTGGSIYSGGFDANGNNQTGKPGIYIGADGKVSCEQINIIGSAIDSSYVPVTNNTWQTGDISRSGYMNYPEAITMPDGTIRVAYGYGTTVKEVIWNGKSWSSEIDTGIGSDEGYWTVKKYLLLKNNTLLLFYNKYGVGVRYKTWNGTAWVGDTQLSASSYPSTSVACLELQDGKIIVAYIKSDKTLVSRTYENDTWGNEQTISTGVAYDPTLIQTRDGVLRIAYTRDSDKYLVERLWTGTAWGSEKIINNAPSWRARYIMLNSGELRIFYLLNTTSYPCKQKIWNGVSWGSEFHVCYTNNNLDWHCIIQSSIDTISVLYEAIGTYYLASYKSFTHAQLGAGIIETGSNSNGSWIKFSDGTMICSYYNNSFSCSIHIAALGGYRSGGFAWYFPAQFLSGTIPVVIGGGVGNLGIVNACCDTNEYGTFTFSAVTSQATADRIVHLLAIGRWK